MPNSWLIMSAEARTTDLSRRGVLTSAALLPLAAILSARPAQATSGRGKRNHVVIVDKMAFGAAPAGVKAGDTVTWTNRDIVAHTATARNGAFDVDLPPGASASAVMSRSGVIAYYCRYHPAMRAQISVAA